ncbi:MAG: DUF6036 family nucleotidyltransferase [Candidatus Edwardsbacteria bacterium]|nr:DUF6036 family nucleotidyltransferase [Candidatus Edwardsbacteria bacterium]
MLKLLGAAREMQRFMDSRGWRSCLIGGLAVIRWGEARLTVDADITLLTGFGQEEAFVRELLQRFTPRRPDMEQFALRSRVVLVFSAQRYPIDIALAGLPFEERMVQRSSGYTYHRGISLRTCSAEDLIVTKAFADRDRDWEDIRGVVVRQAGRLDWEYVHENLAPLADLKEAPHIPQKLKVIRAELGG